MGYGCGTVRKQLGHGGKILKKLLSSLKRKLIRGIFFCLYPILALIYRPRVIYTSQQARDALRSPCIIVCNHTSHKDGLLISRLLLKYGAFTFVAKDWYERPKLKPLFSSLDFLPIDRNSMDTAWLDMGLEKLRAGSPILIFPEGRTSKTGVMNEFHPGFLYIAKRAEVPVIPTCLVCDYKPFHRQKLVIGAPYQPDLTVKGRPSVILSGYAAECRRIIEELVIANGGPIVLEAPVSADTATKAEEETRDTEKV